MKKNVIIGIVLMSLFLAIPLAFGEENTTEVTNETEAETCAASIDVNFNQDVYHEGDFFKITVEIFDSQGNLIPNAPFYTQIQMYEGGEWQDSELESAGQETTDEQGYYEHSDDSLTIAESVKILYKFHTKETSSCPAVEDTAEIEAIKEEAEPEPRPIPQEEEPEPAPIVCAASIKVTFDKDIYYIGDTAKIEIKVLDAQGNGLSNYPFYNQVYDTMWHTPGSEKTDSKGYFKIQPAVEKDKSALGEIKFKVYTGEYPNCNSVEDIAEIEVRKKEEPRPRPEPVPCGIGECIPVEEEEVKPIDVPDEKTFYSCQGCEEEGKCYPVGYRKKGKYCDIDNKFIDQRGAESCDNNFECKANICIGGECLTEGFVQKIIDWLKGLIGIKPKPPEDVKCSKLLIEKNIGDYMHNQSLYGPKDMQVPIYSEDGAQLDIIKCCVAQYIHQQQSERQVLGLACPYANKEDVRNSLRWIAAKEGNFGLGEYKGEKIITDDQESIAIWTSGAYLLASGGDPNSGGELVEDVADAYLKKYPNDLDLTEDDIPNIIPRSGPPKDELLRFCTSEKDMLEEDCHFTDDFENGLGNWAFSNVGAGTEVVENGNTVMRLVGVERANIHKKWDNYLFKFKFKKIAGSVHVDFRRYESHEDEVGAKRYFVAISENRMGNTRINNLNKQVGDEWRNLEEIDLEFDNNWHTLEIRCYDNIINVYVDNELVTKQKDTMSPLLSGWVRFEAHTGGVPGMVPEFLIDDVEIKLITEEDIIYP